MKITFKSYQSKLLAFVREYQVTIYPSNVEKNIDNALFWGNGSEIPKEYQNIEPKEIVFTNNCYDHKEIEIYL